MASNAIFRKIAYFGRNPFPVFLPKCLLVTCPQTPEIITCGDGCAFRWNAEIFIHEDRKRKKPYHSYNILGIMKELNSKK